MDSPEDLYNSGIYINDLSMHDSSRDFILAGSQQNPELNLALNQVCPYIGTHNHELCRPLGGVVGGWSSVDEVIDTLGKILVYLST